MIEHLLSSIGIGDHGFLVVLISPSNASQHWLRPEQEEADGRTESASGDLVAREWEGHIEAEIS